MRSHGLDDGSHSDPATRLADDHSAEEQLATKLEPGYAAGWAPNLIELLLGVSRRDAKLVLEGVRKLSTKFRGKWLKKKHEDWYDRQLAKYPPGTFRYPGTWEDCLERTKDALFSYLAQYRKVARDG